MTATDAMPGVRPNGRLRWSRRLLAMLCVLCMPVPAFAIDLLGLGRANAPVANSSAERELQTIRDAVAKARAQAAAAKLELDVFVVQHFAQQRATGSEPLPEAAPVAPAEEAATDPRIERLQQQIDQWAGQREELLQRFTESHPEVAELEQRITEAEKKLSSLEHTIPDPKAPSGAASTADSVSLQERAALQQRLQRESAARHDQLFEAWQAADRDLQAALNAEQAALRVMAALPSGGEEQPQPQPQSIAATPAAPSLFDDQPHEPESHPVVLAILLVSLVVAAVASIGLARSTRDGAFGSIEDVAAALSLPVVGMVPSSRLSGGAAWSLPGLNRSAILGVQLVLAVGIFALVAVAVQNPQLIMQLFHDPAEAWQGVLRCFGRS